MAKKGISKKTKPENGFARLERLIVKTNENTLERLMVVIKGESDDIRSDMDTGFASVRNEMRQGFAKVSDLEKNAQTTR